MDLNENLTQNLLPTHKQKNNTIQLKPKLTGLINTCMLCNKRDSYLIIKLLLFVYKIRGLVKIKIDINVLKGNEENSFQFDDDNRKKLNYDSRSSPVISLFFFLLQRL